jgi:hypothetical protein
VVREGGYNGYNEWRLLGLWWRVYTNRSIMVGRREEEGRRRGGAKQSWTREGRCKNKTGGGYTNTNVAGRWWWWAAR